MSITVWDGRSGYQVTPELARAIREAEGGATVYAGSAKDDPGLRIAPAPFAPSPAAVEEAKALLPHIGVGFKPLTQATLSDWMHGLAAGTVGKMTTDDFEVRFFAMATFFSDWPEDCFTTSTLKTAMSSFKYFPAVAELATLLEPIAVMLLKRAATIAKVANYKPPQSQATGGKYQATDDEKAQVAKTMADYKSESNARIKEAAQRSATSRPISNYMSDEKLLATYEAELNSVPPEIANGYRIRIRTLREKLGKDTSDV